MAVLVCVCFGLAAGTQAGAVKEPAKSALTLSPQLKHFVEAKEKQARDLIKDLNLKEPPKEVWEFFKAAREGDWLSVSNQFRALGERRGGYGGSVHDESISSPIWSTLSEIEMMYEQALLGEPKYAEQFARKIIQSIAPGAIYFGGTDPGRGLITAYTKDHAQGDPFFTVTQNALADGTYLEYLRHMYGAKTYMPTQADSQQCFQEYLADAQKRLAENKLKPGEDVKIIDNRVQVSGQVAVMAINALLARIIFDKNPDREFFVEESFPLDWMYPHLTPNGLIMKIHRQPVEQVTQAEVEKDRRYWKEQMDHMLGPWLEEDTSVQAVCDFAGKVHARKDLAGFEGDPAYVRSESACKTFSKLRSSIGGLYAWRAQHAESPEENERMTKAADLAFRQSFALCPTSPEAVFRYTNLLVQAKRIAEAKRMVETALKIDTGNAQMQHLLEELQRQ